MWKLVLVFYEKMLRIISTKFIRRLVNFSEQLRNKTHFNSELNKRYPPVAVTNFVHTASLLCGHENTAYLSFP